MDFHHYYEETDGAGYTPNVRYLSQHQSDDTKYQDLADRIDPLLQYHTPCPGSLDGTSGMQRYLQEPSISFFATPHQLPVQNAYYNGIYPYTSSSLRHDSYFRHGSPVSYQYSSAASGPRSPPLTDNDGYVDSTQDPSTPSDTAVLSPHIASFGSPSPSDSLYGVSGVSQYVNPAVIQPTQPLHNNHMEEEMSEFALDLNMGFGGTVSTPICPTNGSINGFSAPSPDFAVEFEHHVRVSYSEIEGMGVNIKVEDETTADTSSTVADDDERKPSRRAKPSRTSRARTRRGRTTRLSPDKFATTSVTKPQRSPRASTNRSLLSTSSGRSATCIHCSLTFSDMVLLQKHITALHNRPFICVFHFAGCTQVFANKNEWKRHVSAQHLNLNYWLCTSGSCGKNSPSISKGASDNPTHCRVFRRKDLYTQHIRRMHAPPEVAQADKKDKTFPLDWIVQEKELQDKALRQRCTLPTFMRCPAEGCMTVFDNGPRTWDNRMEHVAIHLERAANNEEPPVVFGGENDEALTQWASQPDVRVIAATATGWATCQPLKTARIEISKLSGPSDEGLDEDAEGEEC
ncbi:c2h2 finger protein [Fusarium langsethiae]|uniref:C2h2 finger protein n=1 Tax=Fusarium langsethiae TaxID=179993 RepID=A0A0M9EYE8_FUSLA|nr:c2h2 finger protein [Fusarium langsethiae]GKT99819.1 unnamed protein product [Fusarium langsethiae]